MALEPINKFSYTRDWTKPADFPTFEDDEQTVREDMQYQPNELKQFINEALVAFVNDSLIPLVNALVAGTIPADSVYTAAIQNDAVTLAKLGADVTAAALGAPSKVNGVEPDSSGEIVLTGGDIAMSSTDPTTVAGAIGTKQTQTGLLSVESDIADADYLPFYDTSAAASRRTLWSNIVAKIRAAFKTTALPVDSGGTGAADAATARSAQRISAARSLRRRRSRTRRSALASLPTTSRTPNSALPRIRCERSRSARQNRPAARTATCISGIREVV